MNYQITYFDETGLLLVKTDGKMNADDFIMMAKDLLQHSKFSTNGDVIFDHTALGFKDVSVSDLQKIRVFHMDNDQRIGSGKSAMIVKSGLSKEWLKLWSQGEKIKAGNKVQVFESYNDAIGWIMQGKGS